MNVQAAKAARIPTTAVTSLIVDAMGKAGVSKDDAGKLRGSCSRQISSAPMRMACSA